MNNSSATVMRWIGVLFLVAPPFLAFIFWYQIDFEERFVFHDLLVQPSKVVNIEPEQIRSLTNELYNATNLSYVPIFSTSSPETKVDKFKFEVSRKFIEELGVFASLPLYQACLENNIRISIEGVQDSEVGKEYGAAYLAEKSGKEFYAKRGQKDCKNIEVKRFRESEFRGEYTYPITLNTSAEEQQKKLQGESYESTIASTSVFASNTRIYVSLNGLAFVVSYPLFLLAWSLAFFQYKKIINYLFPEI